MVSTFSSARRRPALSITAASPSFRAPAIANPLPTSTSAVLMQAMIESFIDGILILTPEGQLVGANTLAEQICARLGSALSQGVPAAIWQLCQAFLTVQPDYAMAEAEINLPKSGSMRVRVRSLPLESTPTPNLLVILEDQEQPAYKLALNEVDHYGLTPREAEVWLLKRSNYSYKQIAEALYITVNTVKKHLKNIYAKQLSLLPEEADLDGI